MRALLPCWYCACFCACSNSSIVLCCANFNSVLGYKSCFCMSCTMARCEFPSTGRLSMVQSPVSLAGSLAP